MIEPNKHPRIPFLYLIEHEIQAGLCSSASVHLPLEGQRLGDVTVYPVPELEYWLSWTGLDVAFTPPATPTISTSVELRSGEHVDIVMTASQFIELQRACQIEQQSASTILARIAANCELEEFLEWGGFAATDPNVTPPNSSRQGARPHLAGVVVRRP